MEIINAGIHHMDGTYSLSQVNNSHRKRWPDFPSELRPDLYVGYNFIIWKDGLWTQCRFIGEETAAQLKHNFDTVSIALQGCFTRGKDVPTEAQVKTLRWMLKALVSGDLVGTGFAVANGTKINIKKTTIVPHKVLQPGTECYGTGLDDKWAMNLLSDVPAEDPPPVVPAPAGPEETAWIRVLQMWQELMIMWEKVFGRPVGGWGRCSDVEVRG